MSTETKERKRRSPARSREVVIACMQERISMMVGNEDHIARLRELLDELKRSGKKDDPGDD